MYHALVGRIARRNFLRINQKNFPALLTDYAPDIHHRFGGNHALGGERPVRAALGRWFERLGRLGPRLTLTIDNLWVKGWPHDTTIIVRWSATDTPPGGGQYRNRGVHIVHMRWGKMIDIVAHEDSQAVATNLARQVAAGVQEAAAAPILC